MKNLTKILLLVFALTAVVLVYIVMSDGETPPDREPEAVTDPALPAEEQAALAAEARFDAARSTCRDALLDALDHPDSARLEPTAAWTIDEPPDGTIHVRLSAQIKTALGDMIDGTWNCVVLPEADRMRLVTLTLVES